MVMMKKKWMRLREKWFEGEVTLPKTTLWLVCAVCLLGGIVYGLRKAPWTHGVTIGSYNGNCGNDPGDDFEEECEEEE